MRNISSWAIRNPVIPIVLFVALTLLGLRSFAQADVNGNPDIEFPAAIVSVSQPGAAPTEVENQITRRIEAAVRGINGVDKIQSYVGEGYSRTFVEFEIGIPIDRAVNDVREAVSQVRGDLPDGIREPQVTRVDFTTGQSIASFSIQAVDMTLEELSWFVDNAITEKLLAIEGLAAVERSGGVEREIRIMLDPAAMQAHGITAAQVNAQLRQVNLNAAGGRAEIAGAEQAVRVLADADSAFDLGETQIALAGGRTVKLSNIATVRDGFAEQRTMSFLNDRQVLSFSISRAKGYSEVAVYEAAAAALEEIEEANPGVEFEVLRNDTEYVVEQYESAMHAMVEGAVLAVLVVFLFLRDWRATLISALAIPLSAIPTFWLLDLMGFSLNSLSLLALSLVAGVLVDDAIVEIENIVRHMRMGKSAYQASIDAADEIGLAVVATTFSIVAVFFPVGLMPGISGQFFQNFGFTVVASVLMSLAVARLISPMIAAYFLKAKGKETHGEGWLMDRYISVLHWSLRNRWKTMGIGLAAFIATLFAFATLPMTFQPPIDADTSQVDIDMPPGSTLEQTAVVAEQVADIMEDKPLVESVFSRVRVDSADVFLQLEDDRELTSTEFEQLHAPELRQVPDARINFQSQHGGFGRDINVTLASNDPEALSRAANVVVEQMRGVSTIRDPRIDGALQRPEITIRPRLDLAADLGVTTADLSQTIRIATLGDIDQNVAKFSLSDRQIPIRVMLDEEAREDLSTIQNLPVPTAGGGSVPLKVIADIDFGSGPIEITRLNQKRRISIGADLAPGVVTSEAMAEVNALPVLQDLPPGVEQVPFGATEWQAEMLVNFVFAVITGIFLVFAVLVLLYKRFVPPFVNMGSLLLAPLGGAIALHITGHVLSLPVFIGLLMLLGIVAKNSILLIDFAIEEIGKGVPKDEAIIDAGHKRAQPIVMTTVAMVAGMMPIALSLTGDGSFRAPMGIVVIGGLILSTVLTLVIVPAGFSLADSLERWLAPKFGRLLTYKGEQDHGPAEAPQPAE